MKKIAVLVSGGGTNLQALIDAAASGVITSGEISIVISSKPGVFALSRAEKAGIKTYVHNRKEYSDVRIYSDKLEEILQEEAIDLVVLAGFMTVLDDSFCESFKGRIINVHPSLIPSFCGVGYYGLKVHEEALKRGVKITGATVHIVTPECDGGPILLQKAVEVKEDDTAETLQKRVMEEAEWVILPRAAEMLCKSLEERS
ncbi:MAG: phosphoribosylglycinamide formyltransferase [Ruminococcus sp.]|jgi:phosphoribosylglycinamide formyltransferase-1|nr:phosphoribosylglycinamide formyltransferase [Ruminococcus sp.]